MYKNPVIQSIVKLPFDDHKMSVDVLRLDLVHPEISGNKWFKLKYHLKEAVSTGKMGLISFGGAYSNHLVALAYSQSMAANCDEVDLSLLPTVGIIRGEEPVVYGPSLQLMKKYGMKLDFVSRDLYKNKERLMADALIQYPNYYVVPEGGGGNLGIHGATEIMNISENDYTHIICAVGTGTTMAGILASSKHSQQVIGISMLKVPNTETNELIEVLQSTRRNNYTLLYNYHFGGYAKKNDELIAFMNRLYSEQKIPTDFVYTGKLFYAVYDLMWKNFFPTSSNLLVIHSGGLQGNRSLKKGILSF